ncbi:MAG: hypothetical protein LC804_21255 [Acidobacteria bacterium]|nr:hypothetical protein [Acidobacteriota bacterium]
MNLGRAFLAGVIGGIVMSMGLAMGRAMGMPANLEMMLGTMLLQPGTAAFMVGMVMHLMISGLIALIYAWGFETLTHRSGALIGAGFGVIHAIIGGMVMGMMPMMHPLIPEMMPAPGAFMSNLGMMGVMAEFVLHILYGAVVGAIYTPAHVHSPAHA